MTHDTRGPAEILRDAWELISDPDHWTQNAMARKANGVRTGVDNDDATAWCAMGALYRAYPTMLSMLHTSPSEWAMCEAMTGALGRASRRLADQSPTSLNDNGSHEDVALLFKHAIEDVEQGQL